MYNHAKCEVTVCCLKPIMYRHLSSAVELSFFLQAVCSEHAAATGEAYMLYDDSLRDHAKA